MATDDAPAFGDLLRSLRVAAGLTQEALAERAGLSVRAISSLERGERQRPYPHTVQVLARALRLTAAERARLAAARGHGSAPAPEPPAAVEPAPPITGNLPAPLTSFVGRERELAEVSHLLDTTRLLTLTGAGGVGKTRLALEVARAVQADYPDGVWLVELAALADPALVFAAVAWVVGVVEQPGQPLIAQLIDHLGDKALLLVLDNCEHVIEACAQLAEALLTGCPAIRVLTTSREVVRALFEERLALAQQAGDAVGESRHLISVALVDARQGQYARARPCWSGVCRWRASTAIASRWRSRCTRWAWSSWTRASGRTLSRC